MATIDSLVEATIVGDDDLLLIDQGGEGKKYKAGGIFGGRDGLRSLAGFTDELLAQAGIVDDGQPDKLGASQRVDAMRKIFNNVGTASDIAAGKFKAGSVVYVTDRGMAVYIIKGPGWPQSTNGFDVLNAGGSNVAVYQPVDTIYVEHFGVAGSGSDEYDALNAAVQYAVSLKMKLSALSAKTITVRRGLAVSTQGFFEIDLSFCTIKAQDAMGTASAGYLVYFDNCNNFIISNVTADGNRSNRTPAEAFAHSLIFTKCANVEIRNVAAKNNVTDGFYINASNNADLNTFSSNITMWNCESDNSYRNGMSIINAFNIDVYHSKFNNSTGTNPQGGVVIESNVGSYAPAVSRVRFHSCETRNCVGAGISVTNKQANTEIIIKDHYARNCTGGAILASSETIIDGGLFEDFSLISHPDNVTNSVIGFQSGTGATKGGVFGAKFRNITATNSKCIHVNSGVYRNLTVENCDALNVVEFCRTLNDYAKIIGNTVNGSTNAIFVQGNNSTVKDNNVGIDTGIAYRIAGGSDTVFADNKNLSSVGSCLTVNGSDHSVTGNRFKACSSVVGAWVRDFSNGSVFDDNRFSSSSASSDLAMRFSGTPMAVKFNKAVNLNTTDSYQFDSGFANTFFGYNIGGSANGINLKRS